MTTMAHNWKPSEAQVNLLRTIFSERVPDNEPNREQFWKNLTQNVSNRVSFQTAMDALKARPKVSAPVEVKVPVAPAVKPVLPVLATEDGLYRNPVDGTLYRLTTPKKKNSWDNPSTVVSTYSNKAVYRRLTPEGRMVKKGKWTRLKADQSRRVLRYSRWDSAQDPKILASWFMSDEEKAEWAVGFCMFCHKPIIDAVSVWNSIGPDCAKDHGIVREIPPEA